MKKLLLFSTLAISLPLLLWLHAAQVAPVQGPSGAGYNNTSISTGSGNAPTNTLVSLSFPATANGVAKSSGTSGSNVLFSAGVMITGDTNLVATGNVSVLDDAYDATNWNGNTNVPTKNAVRDKIESITAGGWGYTLRLSGEGATTPGTSSGTFYRGSPFGEIGAGTYTNLSVQIPRSGTIKSVWVKLRVAGTLGSGETVSHYVRYDDTTDVGQVDLTMSAANQDGVNTSVSQAVTAGHYVALKIVKPVQSTGATSVRWDCLVLIEP